jgi:hypothetical protein
MSSKNSVITVHHNARFGLDSGEILFGLWHFSPALHPDHLQTLLDNRKNLQNTKLLSYAFVIHGSYHSSVCFVYQKDEP